MTDTSSSPPTHNQDQEVTEQRQHVAKAMSGLMMGMFVGIFSSTVVANALPRIVADLHGSQSSYTWVVTTELLAITATVPVWGKLSDLYSKKLLIQLALSPFVAGSLMAGFAKNHKSAHRQPRGARDRHRRPDRLGTGSRRGTGRLWAGSAPTGARDHVRR
jgi:MFS family permease